MADYKALKVLIGRTPNGRAQYPDFNSLAVVITEGVDWSIYVDTHGTGWLYDKLYGHVEEGPDSPVGQQWGVLVVDPTFADQAVAAFPVECSLITEQECQVFVEERATAHLPEEDVDERVLTDLLQQIDLLERLSKSGAAGARSRERLVALRQRVERALDPDDPEPGVRRSKMRRWSSLKATRNINIVS